MCSTTCTSKYYRIENGNYECLSSSEVPNCKFYYKDGELFHCVTCTSANAIERIGNDVRCVQSCSSTNPYLESLQNEHSNMCVSKCNATSESSYYYMNNNVKTCTKSC